MLMPSGEGRRRLGARSVVGRPSSLVAAVLGLLLLLAPGRLEAQEQEWLGAFESGFGVFIGGGIGGGLARMKLARDRNQRFAVTLPLNLRVGFDIGRYGFAVVINTEYAFHFGPTSDQGQQPAQRSGRLELLSLDLAVMWRPVSPLYLVFGAGLGLTTQRQTMLEDPAKRRALITSGLGFIFRFKRKAGKESSLGDPNYPLAMTFSFESRVYLPFDEHFTHWSLQVAMTFYFIFTSWTVK